MKKLSLLLFLSLTYQLVDAQYRADLPNYFDYRGPVINEEKPTVQNALNNFFSNVKMSHTYSMSFNSFSGSYQNVNAYTNTMNFALSERMFGRVDVSFLHSPFGGTHNFMGGNGFKNQVMISNAELNYKITENAFIRIQYQRLPNAIGYRFNQDRYNRFNRFSSHGIW